MDGRGTCPYAYRCVCGSIGYLLMTRALKTDDACPDIRETLPYTSIERKVLSVWALAQETSAEQTTITSTQAYVILGLVVFGILAAGLVVIYGRREVPGDSTSTPATASSAPPSTRTGPTSVIRSWIAIALVIGLLIFCGAAFLVSDTTLRSTLMGGLVASVGAAVAFYFSSKAADQARADILGAAVTLAQGAAQPT